MISKTLNEKRIKKKGKQRAYMESRMSYFGIFSQFSPSFFRRPPKTSTILLV